MNNSQNSKIIIGTAQLGLNYGVTNTTGKISTGEAHKIFHYCNQHNIILFDTAQEYGDSESIIALYKNTFPNMQVITKAKFKNKNVNDTIYESVCKLNHIQYFMLHSFNDYNDDVINTLCQYQENGYIDKIGVSIYTVEEAIVLLDDLRIQVIQLPFNYIDQQWNNDEFKNKLMKRPDIEIHARSIFLQGILLNPIIKHPKNISVDDFERLNNIIDEICSFCNLSRIQLCFAYVNSFNWIHKYLIGIDGLYHLTSNIDIISENIILTNEQIEFINSKTKLLNPLISNPSKWIF